MTYLLLALRLLYRRLSSNLIDKHFNLILSNIYWQFQIIFFYSSGSSLLLFLFLSTLWTSKFDIIELFKSNFPKVTIEHLNRIFIRFILNLGLTIFYTTWWYNSKMTRNKRVWVTRLMFHIKFGLARITRLINGWISGQLA